MKKDEAIYVLVLGSPRSGTTFFQQFLNTHPKVVCSHELNIQRFSHVVDELFYSEKRESQLHSIGAGASSKIDILTNENPEDISRLECSADGSNQSSNPDLVSMVESFKADRNVKLAIADPLPIPRNIHKHSIIKSIYQAFSGKKEISVIADKITIMLNENIQTKKYIDDRESKQIVLVRNPIKVINSSIHRRNQANLNVDIWHIDSIDDAISEWLYAWRHAVEIFRMEGECVFIKYEDMLNNFDSISDIISDFLQVENLFANIGVALPESYEKYALTEREYNHVKSYFASIINKWESESIVDLIKEFGLLLPYIESGVSIDFRKKNLDEVALIGFDEPTADGRWTLGTRSEICFRVNPCEGRSAVARLYFYPFFTDQDSSFTVIVRSNGAASHCHTFRKSDMTGSFFIEQFVDGPYTEYKLEIIIPRPKKDLDHPLDITKPLGILVTNLVITAVQYS